MPSTDLEPPPITWAKAQHMRSRADTHAVDRHVGLRLEARREELGLSRDDLARQAGVPAVRLRQFEAGETSIPASALLPLAQALTTPVGYLFAGLARKDDQKDDQNDNSFAAGEAESIVLSQAFSAIHNRRVRQRFCALVKAVAARDG